MNFFCRRVPLPAIDAAVDLLDLPDECRKIQAAVQNSILS